MAKPLLNKDFLTTPSLERRKREKRRERPEVKKTPPFFHQKIWGLKTGRKLFHLFGPQNFSFSNLLKTLIFNGFPGKAGGTQFWGGKGYVRKRAKNKKMITVLGVFEFDAFLSCVFGVS